MMKHTLKFILIGLFCCLCNFTVQAQTRNRQYEEYIHKYKDLAIDEMKRYRIPASITLAQDYWNQEREKVHWLVNPIIISV